MTITSGSRTLGFDTPMPDSTQRYHASPAAGDGQAVIRRVARINPRRDHIRALDWNMQVVVLLIDDVEVEVPISGHWATIGKNGFDRYVDPRGRVRKLTSTQKKWTYQTWVDIHGGTKQALYMLRRRNGDTPLTWADAVTYAAERGVVLIPELKDWDYRKPEVADYLVRVCVKRDYPLWAMALLSMKYCREKCAAVITAGGQFAVIFGRFKKLARGRNKIADWTVQPTQVWGPRSARLWLVNR